MSPTMELGGIVKWHFKEGDLYSAGDSLLEIETDKATIDVEAQDDGIMAKILLQDGAKDIPVGKPIAITAEPGDDLATIELPSVDLAEPAPPAPALLAKSEPAPPQPAPLGSSSSLVAASPTQKFFPSVEMLLHENGISREDALAKIPATGPHARITKGDVLAFLGKISLDSVAAVTSFIASRSHLDLSNIELKAPETAESKSLGSESLSSGKAAKPAKPEPVKLSKTFIFSQPMSEEKLAQIVKRATKLSEQFSYSSSLYAKSDLIDPIFEDLVAPQPNTERFKVQVKINEPLNTTTYTTPDAFDLLLGATPRVVSSSTGGALPSVDVDLILNDKVVDSKQRAELFILKFGELLTVPQPEAEPATFDF